MRDSQSSGRRDNEPSSKDDTQSSQGKNESSSKSYYYDDSTGYEVYDEESESDGQTEADRDQCAQDG